MHVSNPVENQSLAISLVLALTSFLGCSNDTILDNPGISLPASTPDRKYSEEAIELNDRAFSVMLTDHAEASRLLDQAIAIDPNYHMAIRNKATLLVIQKNYAEAISCFERLAQLQPQSAETYVGWAYCFHATGKETEAKRRLLFAIAAYNQRLTVKPRDPWILMNRALNNRARFVGVFMFMRLWRVLV